MILTTMIFFLSKIFWDYQVLCSVLEIKEREREKKLQRNSDDFSGRLVLDSVLCSLNIEICNTEVKIIFMQQRTFNWTTHIK